MEVSGSRGSRYEVRLRSGHLASTHLPASCSCPDFLRSRGIPRKHIVAAWCCVVEGNFDELVELATAARHREAAAAPVARRATAPRGELQGPSLAGAVRELRESEAEVHRFREEIQELRAAMPAAPAAVGGPQVAFLTASSTLSTWGRVCSEAESYVYVACFTFAQAGVVAMLEEARSRGLTVKLVSSGRDKGLTSNQAPRLQRLRGCGCEVKAHKGSRLHAKVLRTERAVVIGSCNFTAASQTNEERGVVLEGLGEQEMLSQVSWFDRLFEAAAKFTDGIGEVLPPSPAR